ncbi:killer cell lectin-like receptor subfamily F member 2 [Pogona vitticeps]
MEDEEGYTALYLRSKRDTSRPATPARKQGAAQCPRWYQITLCATCFVIVLLVAAVVALVLQMEAEKRRIGAEVGTCAVKCHSLLRSKLCHQSQGSSSGNSTCKLCPTHWHLYRDQCYWSSTDVKSWNESKDDCAGRNSHLLVIRRKEEMEFLKQIIEATRTYWAGLFVSLQEKRWVWMTEYQFDQTLFQEPNQSGEEYCGAIKNNRIISDVCSAVFRWVCQKDPILI